MGTAATACCLTQEAARVTEIAKPKGSYLSVFTGVGPPCLTARGKVNCEGAEQVEATQLAAIGAARLARETVSGTISIDPARQFLSQQRSTVVSLLHREVQ
jgi:hypothetical protein